MQRRQKEVLHDRRIHRRNDALVSENENRHKDLVQVPMNKDPLPKDLRSPEETERLRLEANAKRQLANSAADSLGLEPVSEESPRPTSGTGDSSPFSQQSGPRATKVSGAVGGGTAGRFNRIPSLSQVGRMASADNLNPAKARALDPRSPLIRGGSQLFGAGGGLGAMGSPKLGSGVGSGQSSGQNSATGGRKRLVNGEADNEAPPPMAAMRGKSMRGLGLRSSG